MAVIGFFGFCWTFPWWSHLLLALWSHGLYTPTCLCFCSRFSDGLSLWQLFLLLGSYIHCLDFTLCPPQYTRSLELQLWTFHRLFQSISCIMNFTHTHLQCHVRQFYADAIQIQDWNINLSLLLWSLYVFSRNDLGPFYLAFFMSKW